MNDFTDLNDNNDPNDLNDLMTEMSQRYSRQLNLQGFGIEAQRKLLQARVLVIGCGGLGIPALQYLTAMGVGTIGIVDGDVVDISNLNRQVIFTEQDAGKQKVGVAKQKLNEQNSSIAIEVFPTHLTTMNALNLIKNFDLVIDATDSIPARYLINDACVQLHKAFVYGAIHKFEGHLSVFNFKHGPTYRCLYSQMKSAVADCNEAGVLGIVPGIIGSYQALEAVKIITGIGKTISGTLQVFDFLNNEQHSMKLKANPESRKPSSLQSFEGRMDKGLHEIANTFAVHD